MQSEVEALLALQEDDARIAELEDRKRALEPRMAALHKKREAAGGAVARARSGVESEVAELRCLEDRLAAVHGIELDRRVVDMKTNRCAAASEDLRDFLVAD